MNINEGKSKLGKCTCNLFSGALPLAVLFQRYKKLNLICHCALLYQIIESRGGSRIFFMGGGGRERGRLAVFQKKMLIRSTFYSGRSIRFLELAQITIKTLIFNLTKIFCYVG